MNDALNKLIAETHFSGTIRVDQQNKTIYQASVGEADRSNHRLITNETKFGIASGTKLFTAIGVLKLVAYGKIQLEDNIFSYITRPFSYQDVTIRQLLSHTSGLPDYYDEELITDFDNFKVSVPWHELMKPSDYYPVMPDRPMKFKPGEQFSYSNGGYILLAILIEALTGDYYAWIENEILLPNNLSHTGFFLFNRLPEDTALGYMEFDDYYQTNIYQLPIRGGGDGGIYSNTADLYHLWNLLVNYKILNEELTEEMLKPQIQTEDGYYGLGVWIDHKDIKNISIVGSDAGVSFISDFDQSSNTIITIISNTGNGAWKVFNKIKRQLTNQL